MEEQPPTTPTDVHLVQPGSEKATDVAWHSIEDGEHGHV